jgi:hypothetical protein
MKYIFTSSTIAIVVVVMLLTIGTGVTNFITPAYVPTPARLLPSGPATLTGVWQGNDGGTYYLHEPSNGGVV